MRVFGIFRLLFGYFIASVYFLIDCKQSKKRINNLNSIHWNNLWKIFIETIFGLLWCNSICIKWYSVWNLPMSFARTQFYCNCAVSYLFAKSILDVYQWSASMNLILCKHLYHTHAVNNADWSAYCHKCT